MTVLGNFLLLITCIIYATLLNVVYFKTPVRTGDQAVGYLWGLLFINAAFVICIAIVYILIAVKNGFHWVGDQPGTRFLIVFFSLLAALATLVLSLLFKDEPGPAMARLRFFSKIVPLTVPFILIVAGFLLLNEVAVPVGFYKWPLVLVAIIGFAGAIGFSLVFINERNANIKAVQQDELSFQEQNRLRTLEEIDTCDVSKNLVFIFVFSDANQDAEVREKAVAKIKTNPHWQQELINRLQNDWAPEAFTFLASNDVDDPGLFIEPIKTGISIQAKLIKESIRKSSHPSNLYESRFNWEVERVVRTAERFTTGNYNFINEVKELRSALDQLCEFKKPVFDCTGFLDNWIKKHQ